MVWGSTLVLRWINRFPLIVYAGGAILAWTAAKMVAGEELLTDYFYDHRRAQLALYPVVIGGVLACGWLRNRQRRLQLARRLSQQSELA
jgi:predicted tellurium resistance membrane protein TerC